MKTNHKKTLRSLVVIGLLGVIAVAGCKKNNVETTVQAVEKKSEKPPVEDFIKDLAKIAKLGFDPFSVKVTPHGYLVEEDILFTRENLDESHTMLSNQQGQYSAKYPLSLERKIKVALDDASNTAKFKQAFDLTLAELNGLKVPLNFISETDTAKAEIIVKYTDLGGLTSLGTVALGRAAEFVNAQGNPGRYIMFNSNPAADMNSKSVTHLSAIMSHEFGHAIGLRHTDYKNRLYSQLTAAGHPPTAAYQDIVLTQLIKNMIDANYGAGAWDNLPETHKTAYKQLLTDTQVVNEGEQAGSILEANHIYGTPASPTYGGTEKTDLSSLMLATAGPYMPTKFSFYDNIAFFGLYGNPAQTAHIRKSLGQFGNITTSGKTLEQIVNEVKALK